MEWLFKGRRRKHGRRKRELIEEQGEGRW